MRETPILLTPGEAAGRLLPLLEAGASVPLRVTGSSMVPFLRDRRDLVSLRAPRFLPYQPVEDQLAARPAKKQDVPRLIGNESGRSERDDVPPVPEEGDHSASRQP